MAGEPEDKEETSGSSLWTTAADAKAHVEAAIDPNVTAEDLRRAIAASDERAAAFALRERRMRGLRELSQLTQEFGGYDAELAKASQNEPVDTEDDLDGEERAELPAALEEAEADIAAGRVVTEDEVRAKVHAIVETAIEEGYADFEKGDYEDARTYAERLMAKK